MEWCFDALPIKYLTFFVLSTENLTKRPPAMVNAVFQALERLLLELLSDKRITSKKVRVQFIGLTTLLPSSITALVDKLQSSTAQNMDHYLSICAPYGGRWEIFDATKKIAALVQSGKLTSDDLNETVFEKYLATSVLPDIDILIRTAEKRISNFALWKLAYSEIYFLNKYFQDLTKQDLESVLESFSKTERRFGGVSKEIEYSLEKEESGRQ
jgi:undecaprenyl diphosphate synthase